MTRPFRRVTYAALPALAALGIAACGSSSRSDDSKTTKSGSGNTAAPVQGKSGGTLTVLANADVDHIDCGETYYQFGFLICNATQSTLYAFKPDDATHPVPQLADGMPTVSADGKLVTIKIKKGFKFSPPVNREVTSKDVKYAIERGFFKSVANGYAGAYYGDVEGAKVAVDPGTKISGITTPDDQTIEFHLTRGTGSVLAGATTLALSAPVPEEYAKPFDAKKTSDYGEHQVSTGPYMIKNDAKGNAIGYQATQSIDLVRNPNWNKALDFRPGYLDAISVKEGNDDTSVASRKIIDGQSMVAGDFAPPPQIIKPLYTSHNTDQLHLVPTGGIRWIMMNTKIKPFDDINVRKAVIAGFNRNAMRLTRGGPIIGDMPTHMLPPGLGGFDEAGGLQGPGLDFLANANGDKNLAAEYFKKAGYASGKYEGNEPLLMVASNAGVAQKAAEVAKQNFEDMGFKITFREVSQDAMYNKYCNIPAAKVAICPNVGWQKDFFDGQTFLDPTFNGKNIVPENNSNWSQLNDPAINKAMDDAETVVGTDARNQAWANIDKSVTEQATNIPWVWDKQPLIASKNVNVVTDAAYSNDALSFESLK